MIVWTNLPHYHHKIKHRYNWKRVSFIWYRRNFSCQSPKLVTFEKWKSKKKLSWLMSRTMKRAPWKKWKPTGKVCCIVPFRFLFLIPAARCYCSAAPWQNITAEDCGPTPAVLIRVRAKEPAKPRKGGSWKKWDSILILSSAQVLCIARNSQTD